MAYTPTVWNCDDELSAEKLNKLEEGVAQIMSDYVPTQWSCDDVITAEKLNKLEQAVAEASEGGSCDLSTAEVTVTSNNSFRLANAIVVDEMDDALITEVSFESSDYPYLVVLYKGEYEGKIQAPDEMSTTSATGSGGVSVSTNPLGGYNVTITGDGTLNVTVE